MSQEKLASRVGVSQQSLSTYEMGKAEPDIKTLKRIAKVFNTSVDFIIGETDLELKTRKTAPRRLNKRELKCLDNFRALSAQDKKKIEQQMKAMLEDDI